MQFLVLNEKQIKQHEFYGRIQQKHVVISIVGSNCPEVMLSRNLNRIDELHLRFDDVSQIQQDHIYFDKGMARDIFDFINKNINQIQLIVVHCKAGLSRSVAVASALAKIINYSDDEIFTKGIPNMFVYSTMLETFFLDDDWQQKWVKIAFVRSKSMEKFLPLSIVTLEKTKERFVL